MDKEQRIGDLGVLGVVALIENSHPVTDCCPNDESLSAVYKAAPFGSTTERIVREHVLGQMSKPGTEFTRLRNFFRSAPECSCLREQMRELLRKRAISIQDQCQILKDAGSNNASFRIILSDIERRARTFEDWALVRETLSRAERETGDAVSQMAKLAKTAEEWAEVWPFLPYQSPDRQRGLLVIREVAK